MTALAGGEPIDLWQAVVLGIVEGVTEFLPISSTGHLIVTNALLGRSDPAFEVAIQAGAITAVLVRYGRDLLRALRALLAMGARRIPSTPAMDDARATTHADRATRDAPAPRGHDGTRRVEPPTNLLWLILIAATPAAIVGLVFEDAIEAWLFDPRTVAWALILGGLALLAIEHALAGRRTGSPSDPAGERARPLTALTPRDALLIGLWQILALIPGASRSAATIAGALLGGYSRTAAAEFSFLVGLPILYGACALELAQDLPRFTGPLLPAMLVATAISFVTALLVVDAFVRFLQRHTFRPFAWYRIAAGATILWLTTSGALA